MKKTLLIGVFPIVALLLLGACNEGTTSPSETSSSSGTAPSSTPIEATLTAVSASLSKTTKAGSVPLGDLFAFTGEATPSIAVSDDFVATYDPEKKTVDIHHAGNAIITATLGDLIAATTLIVRDAETDYAVLATVLGKLDEGYVFAGIDYSSASAMARNEIVTPDYYYDYLQGEGVGKLSDGNMYLFRGTTDSYVAYGTNQGSNEEYIADAFLPVSVSNDEIIVDGARYLVPAEKLGSTEDNPLAASLLSQFRLDVANFASISIESLTPTSFALKVLTNAVDEEEAAIATFELSLIGLASDSSIESFLASSAIPTPVSPDEDLLVNAFAAFKSSSSYQIYGSDVTDTDHEVFYNLYTPNQYLEYFTGISEGYVNKDGAVYHYTPDSSNYAVLDEQPYGTYTDYKEFIKTIYTIDLTMFDACRPDPDDPSIFTYSPELDGRELGRYFLQMCGYDLNGIDGSSTSNFTDNLEEIAFLVDGDIIYVEMNIGDLGEINFQFDSLNSVADMPIVVGDIDPRDYIGTYSCSTMSYKNEEGDYVGIDSSLILESDLTGTFVWGETNYDVSWNPEVNEASKNQILLNLSITSETPNGECIVSAYINSANWSWNPGINIQFAYDSQATFKPSGLYRLQQ